MPPRAKPKASDPDAARNVVDNLLRLRAVYVETVQKMFAKRRLIPAYRSTARGMIALVRRVDADVRATRKEAGI